MTIAIDARMLRQSGIGRYLRNLIGALQKIDQENQYYLLMLREDYDTAKYHSNFHKVLADFRWYGIAEQRRLPTLLRRIKPDLVHFPHFNVPIFYQGKFVVTIHDLIHQHFRMKRATALDPITYRLKQAGYKKVFKAAVANSDKILTPTKFVAGQLEEEWGVPPGKIEVTYEAVEDRIDDLARLVSARQLAGWRREVGERLGISGRFLYYVGNAHPHKNVEGLIEAFKLIRERYGDLQLALSGADSFFWQRVRQRYGKEGVIYTGYVDDKTMVALYKGAACFVMPSFEEGFGIPILEAMACGCPVVSSNAGPLKEVGGEAALYFDPHNIQDMARKISTVLKDKRAAHELVKKGLKRCRQFSWERLAGKTLATYQEALNN